MRSFTSLRGLAACLSLAFLAGCASTSGTSLYDEDATSSGSYQGAYSEMDNGVTVTGLSGNRIQSSRLSGKQFSSEREARRYHDQHAPEHRTIYFDFDSQQIREEFAEILYEHANYLQDNPDAIVMLQGHTDDRGTREYNLALGERRGNSVRNFLMILETPKEQLEVVSYGEERPAARGKNEDAYSKNRRVIIKY